MTLKFIKNFFVISSFWEIPGYILSVYGVFKAIYPYCSYFPATISIPIWLIGIALVLIRPVFLIIKKLRRKAVLQPTFLLFTQTLVNGISCTWEYREINGSYRINELRRYCSECDFLLDAPICTKCNAILAFRENNEERCIKEICWEIRRKYNNEKHLIKE